MVGARLGSMEKPTSIVRPPSAARVTRSMAATTFVVSWL